MYGMIGIFDSGVGGLSVLREIRKLLPEEDYVYFADNAHCPYGEKSRDYVTGRAREISESLIRMGAEIITVACNTATAAAIGTLRKEYSDPANPLTRERMLALTGGRKDHVMFIGMEPAIKPATGMTRSGVVGVLATAGTLKADKYRHTKELADGKVRIVEHVGQGFVELVEKGIISGPEAERTVAASMEPLLAQGADTIVLGCTHYPFLMDTIRKVAGPDVNIIDPAPAVARHLVEVLSAERQAGSGDGLIGGHGMVTLLASGSDAVLKRFAGSVL